MRDRAPVRIEAVVTSHLRRPVVVLQWREVLSDVTEVIDTPEGEEFVLIPVYGRTLASVERPKGEFHEGPGVRGTITEYVERHLPRPTEEL